jgi:uncharacterized Fe-S cluster protein YjdI
MIQGQGVTSISCASSAFCVAINSNVYTFNGSSWSLWTEPNQVDPNLEPLVVSCSSSSFCAILDARGNVLTFNGSSWSGPTQIDSGVSAAASTLSIDLSCVSSSFCAAVVGKGDVLMFNGSSWSAPTTSTVRTR